MMIKGVIVMVLPIPSRELGSVIAIYPIIPVAMIIKIAIVIAVMRMSCSLSFCDIWLFLSKAFSMYASGAGYLSKFVK